MKLLIERGGADSNAKNTAGWLLGGKRAVDLATGATRDYLLKAHELPGK